MSLFPSYCDDFTTRLGEGLIILTAMQLGSDILGYKQEIVCWQTLIFIGSLAIMRSCIYLYESYIKET
jgi:hypothetical protein